MRDIRVISSQLDGADLRRQKKGDYIRCGGKIDNEDIQEALVTSKGSHSFVIPSEAWERIFGGR